MCVCVYVCVCVCVCVCARTHAGGRYDFCASHLSDSTSWVGCTYFIQLHTRVFVIFIAPVCTACIIFVGWPPTVRSLTFTTTTAMDSHVQSTRSATRSVRGTCYARSTMLYPAICTNASHDHARPMYHRCIIGTVIHLGTCIAVYYVPFPIVYFILSP